MKPGRELDALVAEHIFKWRKVSGPTTDYGGHCESFDVLVPPTIDDPFPLYPPRGSIKPWWFCKEWSTDLLAAWEVLKNFYFNIENMVYGIKRYQVVIKMHKDTGKFYSVEAFAESLPEAICKAALIAMIGGQIC